MRFSNPQMRITNLSHATRPWSSLDAVVTDASGRDGKATYGQDDQETINACLSCPLVSCMDGTRQCRIFRAHYKAKLGG